MNQISRNLKCWSSPIVIVLYILATLDGGAQLLDEHNSFLMPLAARISFADEAKGGNLYIVNNSLKKPAEVVIATVAGQTATEVASVLQRALLKDSVLESIMPSVGRLGSIDRDFIQALWKDRGEALIHGWPGEIVLGGTETGLGVRRPVGSLSATCETNGTAVSFRWHAKDDAEKRYLSRIGKVWSEPVNDDAQDQARVVLKSHQSFRTKVENSPYYVVGFTRGLPTNGSYIIVEPNLQADCFFHPFTSNITTNWTGWSFNEDSKLIYAERRFSDGWPAPPVGAWRQTSNRSAQNIYTGNLDGNGGMYRFFIAQTPGQTYRPALRCHIMAEADDFNGEWAFEIMTGVVDPERAYEMDNATRIMMSDAWSELEANGEQIAKWRFDHTMARTDDWIMNQTGAQDSDIQQKDIVLGDSKTAVFFCVRLTGHKPNGIAMDGVRLLDVTDGVVNAHILEKAL